MAGDDSTYDNKHDYVCSYCGQPANYDGRCGDRPYLTCGHDYTGDWDRGTYKAGLGTPVARDHFNPTARLAALEKELADIKAALKNKSWD